MRVMVGVALVLLLLLAPSAEGTRQGRSEPVGSPRSPQVEEAGDSALEARVRQVASELRCPVCRSLSIYDSPSDMAEEMEDLVREKLRSGMTTDEVRAYFVERYGEWILLKPKASGFNWTVWILPVVLLAVGLIFVLLTARRWVQRGREREAALLNTPEGEV